MPIKVFMAATGVNRARVTALLRHSPSREFNVLESMNA
jgi:hypothetical protein